LPERSHVLEGVFRERSRVTEQMSASSTLTRQELEQIHAAEVAVMRYANYYQEPDNHLHSDRGVVVDSSLKRQAPAIVEKMPRKRKTTALVTDSTVNERQVLGAYHVPLVASNPGFTTVVPAMVPIVTHPTFYPAAMPQLNPYSHYATRSMRNRQPFSPVLMEEGMMEQADCDAFEMIGQLVSHNFEGDTNDFRSLADLDLSTDGAQPSPSSIASSSSNKNKAKAAESRNTEPVKARKKRRSSETSEDGGNIKKETHAFFPSSSTTAKGVGATKQTRKRQTEHGSKYLGVSYDKNKGKWKSRLMFNGTRFFLGSYETQEEAALAYDRKIVELRGTLAKTNFSYDEGEILSAHQLEQEEKLLL